MRHRHLKGERLTLASIDDVIARGKRPDWVELARAALSDPAVARRNLRVCETRIADPYAQRHHFWKLDIERRLSLL